MSGARRLESSSSSSSADGKTFNDVSPRPPLQHTSSLPSRGTNVPAQLSSPSESFPAPDASMSNDDESMSSSSSFEIETGSDLEPDKPMGTPPRARPPDVGLNSVNNEPRHLPSYDNVPRGSSASLDGVAPFHQAPDASRRSPPSPPPPTSSSSSSSMWLLTQFAPAMSKATNVRTEMEDDPAILEHGTFGNAPRRTRRRPGPDNAPDPHATPRGRNDVENRRVGWASSATPLVLSEGVRLTSARNEVTGVQVRVRSNGLFLLTLDVSNWMMPSGHGPRARVAIETHLVPSHLFHVESFIVGSVRDETAHCVMETLARTGVSSHAAREHAVYVRIRVGATLEPGVYEVPVRVFTQETGFCDEYLTWSSSVAVSVVDVQLPAPRNWRFRLDLWQHWTALARTHRVALWSHRHFELIDRYMALLSQMGQKCVSVVATEMPWAGQQCYMEEHNASALFEHAILEVYEDPAHGVPVSLDFTHFDRLLALGARHHLDHEIEVFGLLSVWRDPVAGFDAPAELTTHHFRPPFTASAPGAAPAAENVRRRTSSGGSGVTSPSAAFSPGMQSSSGRGHEYNQSSSSPPSPTTAYSEAPVFVIDGWRIRCQDRTTQCVRYLRRVSEVETFIAQFYAHCIALEIADRVRICADEPREVAVFHEQLRFLQRLAPKFRIKLAVNHSEFFSPAYAPPQVVDYVPLLPLACADLEVTRRLAKDARARGGHVSWYVCCGPAFPNQFVSSPLIEGELVGYLTFFFELDGFLRWNYCLWPDQPWDDLRWRAAMWKVGDMYFVLPGQDGWPVETLRLESLRFAGQAFELLGLAQETLAPAQMQQLQRTVAEQILRSSDLEEFGRCADRAREDLYSLDPLDYQRAKTIILNTLAAAAAIKGSGAGSR